MIETHPFGNFVPKNAKYLLLGSFTTKSTEGYEWFYANKKNQFWPIMEKVYRIELDTKEKQQKLFVKLRMALADIILSCERKNNSNLDINLTNIVYNVKEVENILNNNTIQKIFFTSRFVEKKFKKVFTETIEQHNAIELVTLPSPSPRYATMRKEQKIEIYKALLSDIK